MIAVSLLLDENLSQATLSRLLPSFPDSYHVRQALGAGTTDRDIWEHAKTNNLVLVTREEDFQRLSVLHGAPPKVVWLVRHNLGNAQVIDLARYRG